MYDSTHINTVNIQHDIQSLRLHITVLSVMWNFIVFCNFTFITKLACWVESIFCFFEILFHCRGHSLVYLPLVLDIWAMMLSDWFFYFPGCNITDRIKICKNSFTWMPWLTVMICKVMLSTFERQLCTFRYLLWAHIKTVYFKGVKHELQSKLCSKFKLFWQLYNCVYVCI